MKDQKKTKKQLVEELQEMRQRIAELEAAEAERKRAEGELKKSLEQIERAKQEWESTADSLPSLVCLLDDQRDIVRANRIVENWGLGQVVDVKGRGIHELFHPNCTDPACHLKTFWSQAWEELAQGRSVECEVEDRILKRYLSVRVRRIAHQTEGEDRKAASFAVVVAQDITERKRAEEALHESEAELSAIFDNAPMVMILVDQERRVRKVNRGTLEFTGRPAEEMIGLRGGEALRCLHSLDDPKGCGFGPFCETCTVRNMVLDTFETGRSHHQVEASLPFARGEEQEELAFLVSTALLSLPKDQMVLVCIEDITERKRMEDALRESEDKYRQLFESESDAIFLIDNETGRILEANTAALALYGYSREELLCKKNSDLSAEPEETRRITQTTPVIADQVVVVPLRFHRKKDGTVFSVEITGRFFVWRGRQVHIAAIRDITERRRAEEALRQQTVQLEALRGVSLELTAQLDLDTLLRSIVSRAVELLGGTSGGLYLYRPEQDVLEWAVSIGSNMAPTGAILHRGEGLSGRVWEAGEPLIVDDYQHWEGRAARYEGYPWRAVVGVPVRWGEEFLGVLDVLADSPRTFSPADAGLLELLATQAAIAIQNAQLYKQAQQEIAERKWAEEALQQHTRELELLHRASRAFGSSLDLDQVLVTVLEEVRQLLGAVASSVWLIDPETGELVCQQATGLKSEVVRGWRLAPGEGIVGWVASHGGNLIVPDTQADERYFRGTAQRIGLDLRSFLAVPLRVKQNVIGVIEVMDTEVGRFNPTHLTLLELLAASAAIAIENARLFEREREQRELAEALEEAAAAVSSTLDLDQVLDRILEQVEQVVTGDAFSVILVDDGAARVTRWRGHELPEEETHPSRFEIPITKYPNLMKMARMGKPVIVQDTSVASNWVPAARDRGWRRSYVGAPIQVGGATVGFLNVSGTRPGQFDLDDARRLETFANYAATAIKNARLYEQARRDAETKSVLLHEVNHRVKNNLTAIIGLLYAEQRYARAEDPSAYRDMIEDLNNRIRGLARVHNMLSATEWAPLPLDELTRQIIHVALRMLPRDQHISIEVTPSPVRVTPKQVNSLALVINELATNTVKYALPERHPVHISVCIALEDDTVLFEFRDNGPGYPEEVLQLERHGVGLYLIQTMVREGLGGELVLHNDCGAVTTIRFKKDSSDF